MGVRMDGLWASCGPYKPAPKCSVFPANILILNCDCSTELNAKNTTRSEHNPVCVNRPLL